MKAIDIIEAMENIDEAMLLDAKNHRRAIPGWLKWSSLAACVGCALVVGILSLGWILDDSAHPESLPEALAEPEENTWGSEIPPESPVTLQSSKYPLSITVPGEYAENVLVDTPYYYDVGDGIIIDNKDAIFSFFVDYNEEDQLSGLVWFILATPLMEGTSDYYTGQSGLRFMFSSSILGSDENYTYLLCHPGFPDDDCFDDESIEAAKTYLSHAQDSIDILREFVYDNDLTSDWRWKERFAEFTIAPAENTLALLTGLGYYNSPTVTFSSENYPVKLTVPEQFAGDVHVDTPFASTYYAESVFYDDVAFSFHHNYSAEATDAGLVFLITVTPISEFDYEGFDERVKDFTYVFSSSILGEDSEYVYQIVYPGEIAPEFCEYNNMSYMETYLEHFYVGLAILDKFVQENDLSLRSDWYNYFTARPIASTRERLKALESVTPTAEPSPTPTEEILPSPTPGSISSAPPAPTPTPIAEAEEKPEALVISLSAVYDFAATDANQQNNQLLCCEAINGTILEPGGCLLLQRHRGHPFRREGISGGPCLHAGSRNHSSGRWNQSGGILPL